MCRVKPLPVRSATGLHALETLADRLKRSGRALILCGARHQPAQFFKRAEFVDHIGKENITPHVEAALKQARAVFEAERHHPYRYPANQKF